MNALFREQAVFLLDSVKGLLPKHAWLIEKLQGSPQERVDAQVIAMSAVGRVLKKRGFLFTLQEHLMLDGDPLVCVDGRVALHGPEVVGWNGDGQQELDAWEEAAGVWRTYQHSECALTPRWNRPPHENDAVAALEEALDAMVFCYDLEREVPQAESTPRPPRL